MKYIFLISCIAILFFACNNSHTVSAKKLKAFSTEADSISILAQKTLLTALQTEISKNGFAGSIQYCNVHASPMLDSVAKDKQVTIGRISEKFRNEIDKPDSIDLVVIKNYEKRKFSDTVVYNDNKLTYYKPVHIASDLCLRCHGDQASMDRAAKLMIESYYPNDLAINYQLNDFRGMWKIVREIKKK